jgi:hypothetical protein
MRNSKLKSARPASALLVACSLVLAACGGGGEGSSNGSAPNTTAEGDEVRNLANLKIEQAYELRSITELSVEIQMSSDRSFLSICPAPDEPMDVNSFDYDGCMVRSSLDATTRFFDVNLPNHVDQLVAIVWFYENGKTPLIQRWQRQANAGYASGPIWRINEGG